MHAHRDSDRVTLDGACGLESMERIGEILGLRITRTHEKGNTTGFTVVAD